MTPELDEIAREEHAALRELSKAVKRATNPKTAKADERDAERVLDMVIAHDAYIDPDYGLGFVDGYLAALSVQPRKKRRSKPR